MQTQPACLTSFVGFPEAVACDWICASVTCQLRDFNRMKSSRRLWIWLFYGPSTRLRRCPSIRVLCNRISAEWNYQLNKIFDVGFFTGVRKKIPRTLWLFIMGWPTYSKWMLYFTCAFSWISSGNLLFESCHFVFYLCHNWHWSFFACWTCLAVFSSFALAIFSSKLWYCRFLVLGSVSGFLYL